MAAGRPEVEKGRAVAGAGAQRIDTAPRVHRNAAEATLVAAPVCHSRRLAGAPGCQPFRDLSPESGWRNVRRRRDIRSIQSAIHGVRAQTPIRRTGALEMEANYVARVIDLVDPASQHLLNHTPEEARSLLATEDPSAALQIDGSFALMARVDERVLLARSRGSTERPAIRCRRDCGRSGRLPDRDWPCRYSTRGRSGRK